MAASRGAKAQKSMNANSQIDKDRQATLRRSREQRIQESNRLLADLSTIFVGFNQDDDPLAEEILLEKDDFITTTMLRVVLSGVQKEKRGGNRVLSFVALTGAGIVIGMYLIIPIMICLHITDTILSVLIAALILTLMEGIIGIILVKIGTSHKRAHLPQEKISLPHPAVAVPLPTPALSIPLPAPARSPGLPKFMPVVPRQIPAPNVVHTNIEVKQSGTEAARLPAIVEAETIQVDMPRTTLVPPLLKLPTSL